ncbi:MAG: hypothetical protein GY788_31465 [bacterium]|nr:hypothetical protein [bacterium]
MWFSPKAIVGRAIQFGFRICAGPIERGLAAARAARVEAAKSQSRSCGAAVHIHPSVRIEHPQGLSIGNNVYVGEDCYIEADGGVEIQENVHLSRRIVIYSSDHDFRCGGYLPYGPARRYREVVIERNAWIGMNTVILPGVKVGAGAIVGMGAVVARDVPPLAIVGQAPFRTLGTRDPAAYAAAEAESRYGGRSGRPISDVERAGFPLTGTQRPTGPALLIIVSPDPSLVEWARTELLCAAGAIVAPARFSPLDRWALARARGALTASELDQRVFRLVRESTVFPAEHVRIEASATGPWILEALLGAAPKAAVIILEREAEQMAAAVLEAGAFDDNHGGDVFMNEPGEQSAFARAVLGPSWEMHGPPGRAGVWVRSALEAIESGLMTARSASILRIDVDTPEDTVARIAEHTSLGYFDGTCGRFPAAPAISAQAREEIHAGLLRSPTAANSMRSGDLATDLGDSGV